MGTALLVIGGLWILVSLSSMWREKQKADNQDYLKMVDELNSLHDEILRTEIELKNKIEEGLNNVKD